MQTQNNMEDSVTHLIDYTMSSQWVAVVVLAAAVLSMTKHYIVRSLDDEIAGI